MRQLRLKRVVIEIHSFALACLALSRCRRRKLRCRCRRQVWVFEEGIHRFLYVTQTTRVGIGQIETRSAAVATRDPNERLDESIGNVTRKALIVCLRITLSFLRVERCDDGAVWGPEGGQGATDGFHSNGSLRLRWTTGAVFVAGGMYWLPLDCTRESQRTSSLLSFSSCSTFCSSASAAGCVRLACFLAFSAACRLVPTSADRADAC